MPDFKAPDSIQTVDGVVLRAINVAADDFFGTSSAPRACIYTRAAHLFHVIRRDNIVFVRIWGNDDACPGQYFGLDSAGKYAVSLDGRILRRILDTEPDYVEGEDATIPGQPIELPPNPDGGMPEWRMGVNIDPKYLPPSMWDGGVRFGVPDSGSPDTAAPDAGALDAGAPDAGVPSPQPKPLPRRAGRADAGTAR